MNGLGMLPNTQTYGDTWSGGDPAMKDAAEQDDIAGNGIFDGAGAPPTAHAGSGVFESRFSLPGYLYREQPTMPSEVRDTTTGMPIVFQPNAGGSWYEDTREAYRPFDLETPRLYTTQRPGALQRAIPEIPLSVPPAFRPAPALKGFGTVDFGSAVTTYGPWLALGALAGLLLAYFSKRRGGGEYEYNGDPDWTIWRSAKQRDADLDERVRSSREKQLEHQTFELSERLAECLGAPRGW